MHARDEAQRKQPPRRSPTRASATASASPATDRSPGGLMALQRSAGNNAVVRMLAGDGRGAQPVQRMPNQLGENSTVLSGHGRFGDNQRLPANPSNPRSRQLKATFTVPQGVELVVYAPPGAWLENEAAKRVETGNPPTADELELVGDNNKRKAWPAEYPKTFGPGSEVINYKLMPLEARHLGEGAESVTGGTLKEKVDELRQGRSADDPPLTIHYACCGVGHSENKAINDLFVNRGYTVMLRTMPRSPTPDAPPAKRKKK